MVDELTPVHKFSLPLSLGSTQLCCIVLMLMTGAIGLPLLVECALMNIRSNPIILLSKNAQVLAL